MRPRAGREKKKDIRVEEREEEGRRKKRGSSLKVTAFEL